jgi:hypothetical protein
MRVAVIQHMIMEIRMITITGFFIHKGIRSAVKRAEVVSERMLYVIQRGHWYIILSVHAPTYDRSDDTKDGFYDQTEHAFISL